MKLVAVRGGIQARNTEGIRWFIGFSRTWQNNGMRKKGKGSGKYIGIEKHVCVRRERENRMETIDRLFMAVPMRAPSVEKDFRCFKFEALRCSLVRLGHMALQETRLYVNSAQFDTFVLLQRLLVHSSRSLLELLNVCPGWAPSVFVILLGFV